MHHATGVAAALKANLVKILGQYQRRLFSDEFPVTHSESVGRRFH